MAQTSWFLHLTAPLTSKKGVTVSIPWSYFRDPDHTFPHPLLRLIPLHLDNVIVNLYEDEPGRTSQWELHVKDRFLDGLAYLLGLGFRYSSMAGRLIDIGNILHTDDGNTVQGRNPLCADSVTLPFWGTCGGGCEGEREPGGIYWRVQTHVDANWHVTGKTWHRMHVTQSPRNRKLVVVTHARDLPSRH